MLFSAIASLLIAAGSSLFGSAPLLGHLPACYSDSGVGMEVCAADDNVLQGAASVGMLADAYWHLDGQLAIRLGQQHTLWLNADYGHNRLSMSGFDSYSYANTHLSAELRSHYDESFSTTFSLGYDRYADARLSYDLNRYFLKGEADMKLTEAHRFSIGVQGQFYRMADNAFELALWAEDHWTVSPRFSIVGGLQINLFKSLKDNQSLVEFNFGASDLTSGIRSTLLKSLRDNLATFYIRPDVRLEARYQLTDQATIWGVFCTPHRFVHEVSTSVFVAPSDNWLLSNSSIKPQSAWQFSAGYTHQSPARRYELSAEAFCRGLKHYTTYRFSPIFLNNPQPDVDVVDARGRAYGLTLQLRKLSGPLTGQLSYTLSRTQLRQPSLNQGRWFAADQDRPHVITFDGKYRFSRLFSTSLQAYYSTGRPYSSPIITSSPMAADLFALPSSQSLSQHSSQSFAQPLSAPRNTSRLPDYFRLDWALDITPVFGRNPLIHNHLTVGIYNLLGRRNISALYLDTRATYPTTQPFSLFSSPTPYINYTVRF